MAGDGLGALTRRGLIGASAGLALPRVALAQVDNRPVITIAVQRIANGGTLEPLREQSNVSERLSLMITERLIDLNYRGDLSEVPSLAESWRRIDERTVELTLRPDVVFHDGRTMTAEDVAFSFGPERMFGQTRPVVNGRTLALPITGLIGASSKQLPPEIPPVARRLWPGLDQVEIVDARTVRFVNATPDITLESRFAANGSEVISRAGFEAMATWLDYARHPVGTGPYKVSEFRPDVSLVLDAHDAYWGGRPPIKQIRILEVPEVSSRVNGLLSGAYQFACDIPPDQFASIDASAGFEVVGGTILNHRLTSFDKHHPTLRDPRMRLAMAYAIDRPAIIEGLWAGRTVVPAGLQWPFFGKMFIEGWTVPEYDLARARDLVKQSGYKGDPIPYRLLNNYYTNQVASAQVLVEMWRQAGLNVEIAMKENWTQIRDPSSPRGVRDWSAGATFNDPVGSLVSQFGPNGAAQQAGEYENPELSQLCVALETSTDLGERRLVFKRLLEIAEREDPAYTVLHQNANFTGKRKSIAWKPAPSFAMDFRPGNFSA